MRLPDTRSDQTHHEIAQEWAQAGFAVFPVDPRNKRPHSMLKAAKGDGGFKLATSDIDQINKWWQKAPSALVGVVPGSNGCVVLDLDGPASRKKFWTELAVPNDFDLYSTAVINTSGKGGGQHIWLDRRLLAGSAGNVALNSGLDGEQRGDNGYVIAAGCAHPNGGHYEYVNDTRELAEVAAWMPVEIGETHDRPSIADVAQDQIEQFLIEHNSETQSSFTEREIDKLVDQVLSASQGSRRSEAHRAAGRLLELAQTRDTKLAESLDRIVDAYVAVMKANPPKRSDPRFGATEAKLVENVSADFSKTLNEFIAVRIKENGQATLSQVAEVASDEKAEHEAEPQSAAEASSAAESSGSRVDLHAVIKKGLDPIRTELLIRTDGERLLYRGRTHSFNGQPEAGKSWVALYAVKQSIDEALYRERRGNALSEGVVAVVIDYEDTAQAFLRRLAMLGVEPSHTARLVAYYRPQGPLKGDEIKSMLSDLKTSDVVVIDSVNEAMTASGLDPNDNKQVVEFRQLSVNPIREQTDAALVLIDHEGRRKDGSALGGIMKRAGIMGAEFLVRAIEQPAPGHRGVLAIYVTKDREGAVRAVAAPPKEDEGTQRQHVANFVMTPQPGHLWHADQKTRIGTIQIDLYPPAGSTEHRYDFELADEIVHAVRRFAASGQTPISKKRIEEAVRGAGVKRSSSDVRAQIELLDADDWLDSEKGYGGHPAYDLGELALADDETLPSDENDSDEMEGSNHENP